MTYLMPLIPIFIFLLILYFLVFRCLSLLTGFTLIKATHKSSMLIATTILVVVMATLFTSHYFQLEALKTGAIYFFTFMFILFLITLIFSIVFRLSVLKGMKNYNLVQLALIVITFVGYVGYGMVNANRVTVKEVYLQSDKISQSVDFVLISDNHIGSNPPEHLQKVVNKINTLNKDFVVLPGDLLDSRHIELNDLIALNQLNAPVYYTIGNHEVMENRDGDFFKQLNLTVLTNEKASFSDEIDIIGIDFYNPKNPFKTRDVEDLMQNIDIDNSKYNLLLNHEPDQLEAIIDKKIDLQVSGHTHAGQVLPFNFFVRLKYSYIYGLHQLSEYTKLYVTSGVGTWGPRIRTGSKNEIVLFHLQPELK